MKDQRAVKVGRDILQKIVHRKWRCGRVQIEHDVTQAGLERYLRHRDVELAIAKDDVAAHHRDRDGTGGGRRAVVGAQGGRAAGDLLDAAALGRDKRDALVQVRTLHRELGRLAVHQRTGVERGLINPSARGQHKADGYGADKRGSEFHGFPFDAVQEARIRSSRTVLVRGSEITASTPG